MSGRQTTGRLAAVQRLAGRRCVKSGTHSGTARLARKKQSYCRADSQRMAHGEVRAGAPPRVTVGARAGHTGSRDTFLALRFALHAKGEELVTAWNNISRENTVVYQAYKGEVRWRPAASRLPAAYRRPVPSTEPNTVLPVHFSASAFVHCRRTGTFRSVRLQTVTAKMANRIAP